MGSLHNLPASGGLKLDLLKQVKRPGKTECAAKMWRNRANEHGRLLTSSPLSSNWPLRRPCD